MVAILTVFMSIPSCRLVIILDTPISKYFHLQKSKQEDDLVATPAGGWGNKTTHVASRSSRFGASGMGARTVLVLADILVGVARIV
jgi:hypothetical protein